VRGILRAGAGRALSGLLLGLPLAALAQAPPSEQELIERLRQIQGEIAGAAAAPPAPAGAAASDPQLLSPQQVEQAVGERLGVQVLGIEPIEANGGTRYAVKVMNPPGDYAGAFLVTTLLVDAVSGEVLGEAGPGGGLARPVRTSRDAESGLEVRRRTHR